jgi:hypothetical protein
MIFFFLGLACGFTIGYGFGLFIGEWDKRIKDGRR